MGVFGKAGEKPLEKPLEKSIERNKTMAEKRLEDKKFREKDLLGRADNKWINACLNASCDEVDEVYAGTNTYLFSCRKHDWRAKVNFHIKKKTVKTDRYVELNVEKDEG